MINTLAYYLTELITAVKCLWYVSQDFGKNHSRGFPYKIFFTAVIFSFRSKASVFIQSNYRLHLSLIFVIWAGVKSPYVVRRSTQARPASKMSKVALTQAILEHNVRLRFSKASKSCKRHTIFPPPNSFWRATEEILLNTISNLCFWAIFHFIFSLQ